MKKVPSNCVKISNPSKTKDMVIVVPKSEPLHSAAGASDTIDVLRNGKSEMIVLSRNPKMGYICCEIFDPSSGGKPEGFAFTQDAAEIKKVLGNPFTKSASASACAKKMRKFAVE